MAIFKKVALSILMTLISQQALSKDLNQPPIEQTQSELKLINLTLTSFLSDYLFPNIDTPDFDLATHYKFTNNGLIAKQIFLKIDIPQQEVIKMQLLEHQQFDGSKVFVEFGRRDIHLISEIQTSGEKGFLGESGQIHIYPLNDPKNEITRTEYPITSKNSKVGNIYLKITDIIGDLDFTYQTQLCATHKYEDTICDHPALKEATHGSKITINKIKYEVSKQEKLYSIQFDIKIQALLKMGSQQLREFKPKEIIVSGTHTFSKPASHFDYDFIFNPAALSKR